MKPSGQCVPKHPDIQVGLTASYPIDEVHLRTLPTGGRLRPPVATRRKRSRQDPDIHDVGFGVKSSTSVDVESRL